MLTIIYNMSGIFLNIEVFNGIVQYFENKMLVKETQTGAGFVLCTTNVANPVRTHPQIEPQLSKIIQ